MPICFYNRLPVMSFVCSYGWFFITVLHGESNIGILEQKQMSVTELCIGGLKTDYFMRA